MGNTLRKNQKSYCHPKYLGIKEGPNAKNPHHFRDEDFTTYTFSCRAYGNRTRDSSVKGRCINRFTNAPFFLGLQR
jgi:hypothetical protein